MQDPVLTCKHRIMRRCSIMRTHPTGFYYKHFVSNEKLFLGPQGKCSPRSKTSKKQREGKNNIQFLRPEHSIMKKKTDWMTKCERLPSKKLIWVGVVIIQDQSKMIYNVRNVTKITTNPAIKDNHLPNSILRPQSHERRCNDGKRHGLRTNDV